MGIVVLSSKATKELQQQLHYTTGQKRSNLHQEQKKAKKKEPPHDLGNLRSWNWIYDLVGSFCLSTTYH